MALTDEEKAALRALTAAPFPPVEDSPEGPTPPGASNEGPVEAEEEAEQVKDEKMESLEERVDRLEQDMARVLAVTNPELESIG